jgi:hypothetical protein
MANKDHWEKVAKTPKKQIRMKKSSSR